MSANSTTKHVDVAIVGAGPGGTTTASIVKTYAPHLSVAIIERETFPREHVGESLLPTVGKVLDEIGAWDAIECENFPIKIGATYKWGTTDDLWDFNLVDTRAVVPNAPRPAKFDGWRIQSAFQVDRGRFDEVLLANAVRLGAEAITPVNVMRAQVANGRIECLELSDGTRVTADFYVDASGSSGVLRRALGVELEEPASLRNIAIWDYWDNAEWAVTIGSGGTRIQIMSLGYGWIWFIPVSPTRTSIGLVCPADYAKNSGKRPADLLAEAVQTEPMIAGLIKNATPEGKVRTTKDWSFVARQMAGPNWFLVGECAGFADPILSAGISMTMIGARECGYTIRSLAEGAENPDWLRQVFEDRQKQRVAQHIRFANYWYTANAHFTDLMTYTAEIAKAAGFQMDAESAWQWLGSGGFVSLETAGAGFAGHSLEQIKNLQKVMFAKESEWLITKYNVFSLDLDGAEEVPYPAYHEGKVLVGKLYRRDGRELPITGGFRSAVDILRKVSRLSAFIQALRELARSMGPIVALATIEALEIMLKEGWVKGSTMPGEPLLRPQDIPRTPTIDWNHDLTDPVVKISPASGRVK